MKMKFFIIFVISIIGIETKAQNEPAWDDTKSKNWPTECLRVKIESSMDKQMQPAI